MKLMDFDKIAMPTGVKNIKKYIGGKNGNFNLSHKKGTPVHVKAAITYNDLLKHFKQDKNMKR